MTSCRRDRGLPLGRLLRSRRGERSLRELSARSRHGGADGLSPSTLHAFETSKRLPGPGMLRVLAGLYGLTERDLLRAYELERRGPVARDPEVLEAEAAAAAAAGDYGVAHEAARDLERSDVPRHVTRRARLTRAECLWMLGQPRDSARLLLELLGDGALSDRLAAHAFSTLANALAALDQLGQARIQAAAGLREARRAGDLPTEMHLRWTLAALPCRQAARERALSGGRSCTVPAVELRRSMDEYDAVAEWHAGRGEAVPAAFVRMARAQADCLLGAHARGCRGIREAGDRLGAWGSGLARGNVALLLGVAELCRGRWEAALAHLEPLGSAARRGGSGLGFVAREADWYLRHARALAS